MIFRLKARVLENIKRAFYFLKINNIEKITGKLTIY
jgi:hypothetical protein